MGFPQGTALAVLVALVAGVAGWAGVPGAGAVSSLFLVLTGVLVLVTFGARWVRRLDRLMRPPVPRGGRPELRATAQAQLGPLIRDARLVGVVVATTGTGATASDAVSWGGRPPLDPETVLEIGSITKAVTGVLLADLVLEGIVDLDQDVSGLLPLPQLAGVTLADLATHRGGLPRLPRSMRWRALSSNPYRGFDERRLLAAVPASTGPGAEPVYSNLGFALLGLALARAAGRSYTDLVTERILRPLAMASAAFGVAPGARGHGRSTLPVPTWDLGAFGPAGGIRCSTADLLRLAAAVLTPPDTAVGRAITLATTPRASMNGSQKVGLGWMIDADRLIWHNGGTAGAYAWIGADRQFGAAAVVAAPSAPRPQFDRAARALLEQIGQAQGRPRPR